MEDTNATAWLCEAFGASRERVASLLKQYSNDAARVTEILLATPKAMVQPQPSRSILLPPNDVASATTTAKKRPLAPPSDVVVLNGNGALLRTLGSVVVQAYSTRSGKGILRPEEEVVLECTVMQEKGKKRGRFGSGSSQSQGSAPPPAIVRFYRARDHLEVGRVPNDVTRWLSVLLADGLIAVRGTVVDAPQVMQTMTNVLLNLTVSLTATAFTPLAHSRTTGVSAPAAIASSSSLSVSPTSQDADARDAMLQLRRDAFASLFGLCCVPQRRGTSTQQPQDNYDQHAFAETPTATADLFHLENLYGDATDDDDALLPERTPRDGAMMAKLTPYQKQALYWMTHREEHDNGTATITAEGHSKSDTIHPLWVEYSVQGGTSMFYFSPFSGEVTLEFPSATQTTCGGILADEMGLGKTVEMLSLVMENAGEGSKNESRATLVVAPLTLVSQWQDEALLHTTLGDDRVLLYYGPERSAVTQRALTTQYDIVITTYGTVSSEYESLSSDASGSSTSLFSVPFRRLILDEAHTIKNPQSTVSKACTALRARRRWCVTGTPVQNQLGDLFSLFRFLHAQPWSSRPFWRANIEVPFERKEARALDVLRSVLQPMMLRRTKNTRDRHGAPILQLPPVDEQIIEVHLSAPERDFYDALFKGSRTRFSDFVRRGTALSNYATVLELLLRLRQACDHPFLLSSASRDTAGVDLEALMNRFLSAENGQSTEFVESVRRQISSFEDEAPVSAEASVAVNVDDEDLMVVGRDSAQTAGCSSSGNGGDDATEDAECPICLDRPEKAVILPCLHIGCGECLVPIITRLGACPVCQRALTVDDLVDVETVRSAEVRKQQQKQGGSVDDESGWRPSTKLTLLTEDLVRVRDDDNQVADGRRTTKSVVFSQFTSMLNLCEVALRRENIAFVRIDGSHTQAVRRRVIETFSRDPTVRVFLLSLRVGGVGLNLTSATRVYLLDLWWNPAVELQAINRVHRIGQQHPVVVRRFVVVDSIEERLLRLQKKKEALARHALTKSTEGADEKGQRLEDLRMLFEL